MRETVLTRGRVGTQGSTSERMKDPELNKKEVS